MTKESFEAMVAQLPNEMALEKITYYIADSSIDGLNDFLTKCPHMKELHLVHPDKEMSDEVGPALKTRFNIAVTLGTGSGMSYRSTNL